MDHTTIGKGARLRRAIIDRFNVIEPSESVGFDRDQDERRRYHVDPVGDRRPCPGNHSMGIGSSRFGVQRGTLRWGRK